MLLRTPLAVSVLLFATACASLPTAPTPDSEPAVTAKAPDARAAEEKQKAEAKQQKVKDLQRELRKKQRELEQARAELAIAAIERELRMQGAQAAIERAVVALELSRDALQVFLGEQKPRELEEKKISLDRGAYAAEEAKDELGELVAMYEADEFAKTTKELVIKRSRRHLELADRELAITKRENAEFEQHTLPRRERELKQKVADAELEHGKAGRELEKTKLELQAAEQKGKDRLAELEEDLVELQAKLAKESA